VDTSIIFCGDFVLAVFKAFTIGFMTTVRARPGRRLSGLAFSS
jgi:hypothetical protein